MEVVLRKMGNSTALVVPPLVLKDLGIGVGKHLMLNTTPDGKIILTPKKKYTLANLLAQCDSNAQLPADMDAWGSAPPVGNEVW